MKDLSHSYLSEKYTTVAYVSIEDEKMHRHECLHCHLFCCERNLHCTCTLDSIRIIL